MCSADVSILLSNQYDCVPLQQLAGCMTRPFLSEKGVACETTPGSPPESWFFLLLVQTTKMLSIIGSICHCLCFVWNEQVWTTISCSHLLSSLTVHCSYRLKFFVVRDHLWDGNSPPQLQSSWLRSTRGSRRSKYTEGVGHSASQRAYAEFESSVRGGPELLITKLMSLSLWWRLRLSPGAT